MEEHEFYIKTSHYLKALEKDFPHTELIVPFLWREGLDID